MDNIDIRPGTVVNLTRLGKRHAEVVYMTSEPKQGIVKLDKKRYMVIKTGEIKEFKQNDGKVIENLRVVFRKLEHLIKTNFDAEENAQNALFLTLTYDSVMTDVDRLMIDYEVFFKRLKRDRKGHKLDYIAVAEPQESGSWHMHVIIKSDQPILYIDNKKLTEYKSDPDNPKKLYIDPKTGKPVIIGGMWGHGYTESEKIKGKDPGKYFAAYFTSLEVEAKENDPNAVYVIDPKGKKHKKGARLFHYPKGMKFYRCTRGISRPAPELAIYSEVKREYGKPLKIHTYAIQEKRTPYNSDIEPETMTVNTIQREEFRKKPDK